MRTISQKRKRAARMKVGACAVLATIILMPKMDDFDFEAIPFPLVTTAIAAPSE